MCAASTRKQVCNMEYLDIIEPNSLESLGHRSLVLQQHCKPRPLSEDIYASFEMVYQSERYSIISKPSTLLSFGKYLLPVVT